MDRLEVGMVVVWLLLVWLLLTVPFSLVVAMCIGAGSRQGLNP